jgi:hypothetical protein
MYSIFGNDHGCFYMPVSGEITAKESPRIPISSQPTIPAGAELERESKDHGKIHTSAPIVTTVTFS